MLHHPCIYSNVLLSHTWQPLIPEPSLTKQPSVKKGSYGAIAPVKTALATKRKCWNLLVSNAVNRCARWRFWKLIRVYWRETAEFLREARFGVSDFFKVCLKDLLNTIQLFIFIGFSLRFPGKVVVFEILGLTVLQFYHSGKDQKVLIHIYEWMQELKSYSLYILALIAMMVRNISFFSSILEHKLTIKCLCSPFKKNR